MKKFTSLFIFSLLVASCTTYQTLTVKSTNTQQTTADGPFAFDNDSVHIEYSFTGQNGTLNIKIQNKLDKPIIIDWNRSALILNGQAISMANQNVPITGDAETRTTPDLFRVNGVRSKTSYSGIDLNGTLPQNMDFIPPHSYINKQPIAVLNKSLTIDQSNLVKTAPGAYSPMDVEAKPSVKKADYTESSSPLKFDTYLTFLTKDASDSTTASFVYKQNFYVSQLYVSNIAPNEIGLINPVAANRFFVH